MNQGVIILLLALRIVASINFDCLDFNCLKIKLGNEVETAAIHGSVDSTAIFERYLGEEKLLPWRNAFKLLHWYERTASNITVDSSGIDLVVHGTVNNVHGINQTKFELVLSSPQTQIICLAASLNLSNAISAEFVPLNDSLFRTILSNTGEWPKNVSMEYLKSTDVLLTNTKCIRSNLLSPDNENDMVTPTQLQTFTNISKSKVETSLQASFQIDQDLCTKNIVCKYMLSKMSNISAIQLKHVYDRRCPHIDGVVSQLPCTKHKLGRTSGYVGRFNIHGQQMTNIALQYMRLGQNVIPSLHGRFDIIFDSQVRLIEFVVSKTEKGDLAINPYSSNYWIDIYDFKFLHFRNMHHNLTTQQFESRLEEKELFLRGFVWFGSSESLYNAERGNISLKEKWSLRSVVGGLKSLRNSKQGVVNMLINMKDKRKSDFVAHIQESMSVRYILRTLLGFSGAQNISVDLPQFIQRAKVVALKSSNSIEIEMFQVSNGHKLSRRQLKLTGRVNLFQNWMEIEFVYDPKVQKVTVFTQLLEKGSPWSMAKKKVLLTRHRELFSQGPYFRIDVNLQNEIIMSNIHFEGCLFAFKRWSNLSEVEITDYGFKLVRKNALFYDPFRADMILEYVKEHTGFDQDFSVRVRGVFKLAISDRETASQLLTYMAKDAFMIKRRYRRDFNQKTSLQPYFYKGEERNITNLIKNLKLLIPGNPFKQEVISVSHESKVFNMVGPVKPREFADVPPRKLATHILKANGELSVIIEALHFDEPVIFTTDSQLRVHADVSVNCMGRKKTYTDDALFDFDPGMRSIAKYLVESSRIHDFLNFVLYGYENVAHRNSNGINGILMDDDFWIMNRVKDRRRPGDRVIKPDSNVWNTGNMEFIQP